MQLELALIEGYYPRAIVGPDGWALSTSARALQQVLALCPPEVRLCF